MKILLAEDDLKLGKFLQDLFKNQGMEIDVIDNGEEIEYYALNNEYDVLILDWMLPKKSGAEACKDLRLQGYQKGILMLTAKTALTDKLEGFSFGADDYITKPFEFQELLARVTALGRRAERSFQSEIFTVKSCSFDCTEKSITCLNKKIKLTSREFQIVELLARNAGQVIKREVFFDRIWGNEKEVSENSIDTHIKLIRKKLDILKNKTFIQNIRGIGYRWEESDV